ncbi:TetR/AcrR family transcriptional regulator [Nonomuraea candida]|uniref:TetR/AcrR family transcriptional regulator n=1 Tax=Nonomuraea candida TaxID=359159 RepID=UPI0005B78FA8|nr:TetR/AcrR family transcriptional regulator [Nonomuraea candida]
MKRSAFLRARRPEHKQQRREAILDAARELARASGVRNVSLGAVAEAVGLAKSNIVRYFGTREEIYLQLMVDEWRQWADDVSAHLAASAATSAATSTSAAAATSGSTPATDSATASGSTPATDSATASGDQDVSGQDRTAHVVAALAETIVDRPLLCDLLGNVYISLEHNASVPAARTFKRAIVSTSAEMGAEVARAAGLTEREGLELVSFASVLAGTLYPIANPAPALAQVYAEDPELAAACPQMLPTLVRALTALAVGLPALRDRPAG